MLGVADTHLQYWTISSKRVGVETVLSTTGHPTFPVPSTVLNGAPQGPECAVLPGFHQGPGERARLCGGCPRKGPYAEKTPLPYLFHCFLYSLSVYYVPKPEGSEITKTEVISVHTPHTPVGKQSMTGWTLSGLGGWSPEEVVFKSENYRGKQGVAG